MSELRDYQNSSAIREVIGCLLKDPTLLVNHKITKEDFVEAFHKLLFVTINNLFVQGVSKIDAIVIEEAIKRDYSSLYNIYTKNNGNYYVTANQKTAILANFEANYNEMKKFTALRGLRNQGIEVDDLFDPSEPDPEVADKKRALLNKMSVEDVISHYRQKVLSVAVNFSYKSGRESLKAGGQDLLDQVESWKETPSFGLSYASNYLTTVAMGMRPRRFNISSAGTGVGKSRLSIANICHTFAPKYYDLNTNTWVNNPNGSQNAALYIGTEMELVSEIEPIMLAYMSGVPEPHILMGQYEAGEEERVKEAIKILTEEGKIWLEYVPDYDAATLENIIEEHVDLHGVKHVFFDYIHTTTQLISEYQQAASARIQIREDQVLGDLSRRLKDMTRKFDVCIESWTQVSGDFKNEANRDQTIIRGSKAVAD